MTPTELKEARQKLGLTQQQLADALEISRVWIKLMEAGKKDIERRTELAIKYLILSDYPSHQASRFPP